LSEQYR